jgi:FAD/FMN-containing dehydrogenase
MSEPPAPSDATVAERAEARRLVLSGVVIGGLDLLAFGTLGVIAEVTLKLTPLVEIERAVVARFADPKAASHAACLIARSSIFPMATTLHDAASSRRVGALLAHAAHDRSLLVVRCGGNARSVARQMDGATSICRSAGAEATSELDRAGTKRAWPDIRELAGGAQYSSADYAVVKLTSLPSDAGAVLDAARMEWPACELTSHPSCGVTYAHVPVDVASFDPAAYSRAFDGILRRGWIAHVLSVPDAVTSRFPATRDPGMPAKLVRSVKAAFDPSGVLDPGRLPGGV